MSAADIYAQCLLPLKEGYPLYRPELHRRIGDHAYEAYRSQGVSIGDVGIIRRGGDFDFLFNICNDPLSGSGSSPNASGSTEGVGVAEPAAAVEEHGVSGHDLGGRLAQLFRDFLNIAAAAVGEYIVSGHNPGGGREMAAPAAGLIDPGEVSVMRNYISRSRPYLACGREEVRNVNAQGSTNSIVASPPEIGIGTAWKFDCSSRQGAIVVAPAGATLTEALEEERFTCSIERVKDWFNYATEERRRRFTSLSLVTGVIKCNSWSVAAISKSSQTNRMSLFLDPAATGTLSASHTWRNCLPTMGHSGPEPPSEAENQCIFIRGFRIMRQSPVLRIVSRVKALHLQEGKTDYYTLSKPASRTTSGSGLSQSNHLPQTGRSGTTRSTSNNASDLSMDSDKGYVVENLSQADEPYHPSDIINRFLLFQVPTAEFSITHDRVWWTLMKPGETKCLDENELLSRVCQIYRAALRSGVVCLELRDASSGIPTSDSNRKIGVGSVSKVGVVSSLSEGNTGPNKSVPFSPDGKQNASDPQDLTTPVKDAQTGRMLSRPLMRHSDGVTSVVFSPDGKQIVSGSSGKSIRVWDAQTGHKGGVTSVAFSPGGMQIVSGSSDKTIRVWDAETGDVISPPFGGHTSAITSVAFSPDGKQIVSGSSDWSIRVWDAQTGHTISGPFKGHRGGVTSVAFSPGGMQIVSGSSDKTIRVCDAETGDVISGPFGGHTSAITSVAFSPDGKQIVSGSSDLSIRLWDAQTGRMISRPFIGHMDGVTSVAFSPDGKQVVSGSFDKTIRVWDAQTGHMISGPFRGHVDGVTSVAFSPDGKQIVSGSLDKTIGVWDVVSDNITGCIMS